MNPTAPNVDKSRASAISAVENAGPLRTPQKPSICPVVVRAPRLEASLLVQLIGEVDIGPAIQQISQVQTDPRQVHRIDLEIAPIQRPVGIVVIDLARAPRIFGALDSQRYTARRAEFVAGV